MFWVFKFDYFLFKPEMCSYSLLLSETLSLKISTSSSSLCCLKKEDTELSSFIYSCLLKDSDSSSEEKLGLFMSKESVENDMS